MSDNAGGPGDPPQMSLNTDAAHVRREEVGDVVVFAVENENIYPKQAEEITGVIRAGILSADPPRVLADLSRVKFICSAFIGHLIELHKEARDRSGEVKICVTGEHAAYTMKLVKLSNIIEIGGDRQKLIESF